MAHSNSSALSESDKNAATSTKEFEKAAPLDVVGMASVAMVSKQLEMLASKYESIHAKQNRINAILEGIKEDPLVVLRTHMRELKHVVVIDGEIGAAKSTLIPHIAHALRAKGYSVAIALEPVAKWQEVGILGLFQQDPAQYAYSFQTYTFVTRIQTVRSALETFAAEHNHAPDVLIMERSPLTDRYIFMELQNGVTVSANFMKMYDQWCNLHSLLLPVDLAKAKYFYLKTSLEVCMERVNKRARTEELFQASKNPDEKFIPAKGGVSLEYQKSLRGAHESFFEGKHGDKLAGKRPFPLSAVTVIGSDLADANFVNPGPALDKILKFVLSHVNLPKLAAPPSQALAVQNSAPPPPALIVQTQTAPPQPVLIVQPQVRAAPPPPLQTATVN